jgi:phosphoribosylglycinamide formyltransferase 1
MARAQGVEALALPVGDFGGDLVARDTAIRDALLRAGVRLVVCAGYDRVLSDPVLQAFPDAILNVHPSLLPAFAGGMHAVEDALAFGAKVSGCTVQLLEPGEPDGGPVVLQAPVPVLEDDDADSLRMRIHEQEWRILPEAVALWCSGRLRREGRRVRILPVAAGSSTER